MRFALFLPTLLLAACATAPAATATAATAATAPAERTVRIGLESVLGGRGQHVVVVNALTVPITVTSLILRDCQNIRNACGATPLAITVRPGEKRRIATVTAENTEDRHHFAYDWTWTFGAAAPD